MAKKFLRILCVLLCLCLVLTACGNKKTDDKNETEGAKTTGDPQATNASGDGNTQTNDTNNTAELNTPWGLAIRSENFSNFTIKLDVTFADGRTIHDPGNNVYAFNGDAISLDGGKTFEKKAELLEHVRTLMVDPVLNLIRNAENIHMASQTVYTIPYSVCTVNYTVYQATITANNAVLTLDADGHLETFSCKMAQDINIQGEGNTKLEMDVTFTFSNYGTTH